MPLCLPAQWLLDSVRQEVRGLHRQRRKHWADVHLLLPKKKKTETYTLSSVGQSSNALYIASSQLRSNHCQAKSRHTSS